MVSRLAGLNTIMRSKRSAKGDENSLRKLLLLELVVALISFIMDLATSDSSELISSSLGWPVKRQIFSIWSSVELPGNKGFCARI